MARRDVIHQTERQDAVRELRSGMVGDVVAALEAELHRLQIPVPRGPVDDVAVLEVVRDDDAAGHARLHEARRRTPKARRPLYLQLHDAGASEHDQTGEHRTGISSVIQADLDR
jgi:hypothetical protein